ncbi:MAG TPA: hypothetical protein VGU71_02590 [Candidatus Dormibacteraeota bacterium]|nr:hypothetical protein [Candidatus Dormibacteraeota bacterium]
MPTKPSVPAALRTGPFTSAEADGLGVTRSQLRGAGYRRMGSGLYRWVGLKESPQLILSAIARRLPAAAAFSGRTAAWLHGLDFPPLRSDRGHHPKTDPQRPPSRNIRPPRRPRQQ